MKIISGVDGCRSGWVVISKDLESGNISWRLCHTIEDILKGVIFPEVLAIDNTADDILDAFAALWTVDRIHLGAAQSPPEAPDVDSKGLRMEIVYINNVDLPKVKFIV